MKNIPNQKNEAEDWDDQSITDYSEMQKFAFVTQRAIDCDFIGFCYREYSDIKIDSGWRFLYGDEDEDYLDNPDNVITKDLSDIVEWKPELKDVLSRKPGTELEWDAEKEAFVEL